MIGWKKKKQKEEKQEEQKQQPAAQQERNKKSRPIFFYFLPLKVLAVLIPVLAAFGAGWLNTQAGKERLGGLAQMVARSLQHQVEGVINDRLGMLRILAGETETRQALAQGDAGALETLRKRMATRLPDALEVIPVPAGLGDEQLLKAVGGSYAAAELSQKALEKGEAVPVQVARGGSGLRVLMAVPVKDVEKVLGLLLAVYPSQFLQQQFSRLQPRDFSLVLEQNYGGARVRIAASGPPADDSLDQALKIGNSSWQLRYSLPSAVNQLPLQLLAVGLGGGFLLLLGAYFTYRRLAADCRYDMNMMVNLVGATLKRSGTHTPVPKLEEAQPAVELLTRYAQAAYAAQKAARREAHKRKRELEAASASEKRQKQGWGGDPAQLPEKLFGAGVIRGVANKELGKEAARAIGLGVGTLVTESGGGPLFICRDNRKESEQLSCAFSVGVLATGCDVVDLGAAPAALLYRAVAEKGGSGVVVTGGHSPADWSGFKIILAGRPLGRKGLLGLRKRILEGPLASGQGLIEQRDLSDAYLERAREDLHVLERLRVVIDAGNGVTGDLAQKMFEALGCEVIPLYSELATGFPNRGPDVANPANLEALSSIVRDQGASLGIAFDSDGGALALVDEQGRLVPVDLLLMALAGDVIRRHPGADVIYDAASSSRLPEFILSNGGRPIMERAGHARMIARLNQSQGMLAGESSGHFYLRDRWHGFDDALYAAGRILELITMEGVPASAYFESLQGDTLLTPLYTVETTPETVQKAVETVTREGASSGAEVEDLDGARVEFPDTWGLVRPSITGSALVFRFEAKDQAAMDQVQQQFRQWLQNAVPEITLPF